MQALESATPFVALELKSADNAGEGAGEDTGVNEIVTKALDGLRTTVDERFTALESKAGDVAKLADRLAKVETKLNRPNLNLKADEPEAIEKKAFLSFCRKGVERLSADEVKALTVAGDGTTAGYLAPTQFAAELLKLLVQYSPIRQYARTVSIGASSVKYPRRTSSTAAVWVDETEDRTESHPAYEQVTLTPYELATFTDISTQLLEDNAYNLEGELAADFAESFGKTEGLAFVSGNGTGKPKGLLAASGISVVKTGVAADFPASNPADKILDLFHALPAPHAQNAVWLMNRTTLGTVRKWKDGQGRYLAVDPITAGAPVTLLGRPVVEAIDMDSVGANKFPIMFGDLSGYRIVDRVSLSVLRDPYSLATKGQVRFHARKRVGADVTHPDRFVKLQCAV